MNESNPEVKSQPEAKGQQFQILWDNFLKWIDMHGPQIQTISILVQALTAVLMLSSLIFGYVALRESHAALLMGQQQLETTIEPRLDIFYEGSGWPSWPTNGSIVKFKNVGAVSISNLEIVLKMQVIFDKNFEISGFARDYGQDQMTLLTNSLPQQEIFVYDFEKESELHELLTVSSPDSDIHAVCFVVRYRRSFDMKPKYKLIMFFAMHSMVGNGANPVAWPVDVFGWQTTERQSDKGISVFMQPREKVKELLMKWEIPISVED